MPSFDSLVLFSSSGPINILILSIAFLVLFVASLTDLKTREVPDFLNYGLVMVGVALNLIISFYFGILLLSLVALLDLESVTG